MWRWVHVAGLASFHEIMRANMPETRREWHGDGKFAIYDACFASSYMMMRRIDASIKLPLFTLLSLVFLTALPFCSSCLDRPFVVGDNSIFCPEMEKRSSQSLEKAHSLRSRLETRPLRRPLLSGLKIDKIWASEHEIEGSQMKEKREAEKKELNKRLEWSKNQGEELRKRNIKLDKKNLVVSNRLEVSKKVIAFYSIDSVEPRQSKFTERFFVALLFIIFCLVSSNLSFTSSRAEANTTGGLRYSSKPSNTSSA